jgi:hypothetical protein
MAMRKVHIKVRKAEGTIRDIMFARIASRSQRPMNQKLKAKILNLDFLMPE